MKKEFRSLTRTALLCAVAIALSALEGIFTPLLPPGAKAGLSNVVVMLASSVMGAPCTFAVVLFKATFALLTRGVLAAAFSLLGGVASALLLLVLFRFSRRLGIFGISIAGAFTHSAAQLLLSFAVYGSAVLAYAPIFLLMSLPSGLITAALLRATMYLSAHHNPLRKEFTS